MEYTMKLNWAKRICNIHFKLVEFGLLVSSRYLPEEQS